MWPHAVCLCLVWMGVTSRRLEPQTVSAYPDSLNSTPTPDMIRQAGYLCEVHTVVTEDGYILQVHRIPGGRDKPLDKTLAPVFLQHGLLDSSADWVINGPGKALSYILADHGYDVWLGNARGNIYSKTHQTIPNSDIRFWNWTWHEMGYYDLPAVLDYVLEVTGHHQLHYIGHSMGTTMFFVMCSTRPQYNNKIRSMIALAPVAFMANVRGPMRTLAAYAEPFQIISDYFGHGEFLPRKSYLDDILKFSCELSTLEKKICEYYIFIFCGYDPDQLDESIMPLILGHSPSGESTKTLIHYAQEIKSRRFRQFDYGPDGNSLMYNSSSPPQYNLSLVAAPVSLIYAINDKLAATEDVATLYKALKNPTGMFKVNFTSFNHLDFLWAKDVKSLVYDYVVSLLQTSGTRCIQPVSGLIGEPLQPCSASLLKVQIKDKSFMNNSPAWRDSVIAGLKALSKQ